MVGQRRRRRRRRRRKIPAPKNSAPGQHWVRRAARCIHTHIFLYQY